MAKVRNSRSGIALPPNTGINPQLPGNKEEQHIQPQISSDRDAMTVQMQQYVNQVASQKKRIRQGKVDNRRSNDLYASLPIAIERSDMEDIAKIIASIPRLPGRIRPDFSKEDYIRNAVKKMIKIDKKKIKKDGKIFYSRSYNSVG